MTALVIRLEIRNALRVDPKDRKAAKAAKVGRAEEKGDMGKDEPIWWLSPRGFSHLEIPMKMEKMKPFATWFMPMMMRRTRCSRMDKRRKNMSPKSRTPALSESEWEQVSSVRSHGYSSSEIPAMPWKKEEAMVAMEEVVIETKNVKVFTVESIAEVIPKNFPDMTVRDLAMECLKWGVQVSGNKGELSCRIA